MMRVQGPQKRVERQQVSCPRCESANTKFCYYNNYSLSQPRHFCKNCRRYWTQGGALRSVPVGGGCRKNKHANKPAAKPADCGPSSFIAPISPPAIARSQQLLPGLSTPDCNYNYSLQADSANIISFSRLMQEPLIRAGSEVLPGGAALFGGDNNQLPTDAAPCLLGFGLPHRGSTAPLGSDNLRTDAPASCFNLTGKPETSLIHQLPKSAMQFQLQEEVNTGCSRVLPGFEKGTQQGSEMELQRGGGKGFFMESLTTHNSGHLNGYNMNATWPQFFPLSGLHLP